MLLKISLKKKAIENNQIFQYFLPKKSSDLLQFYANLLNCYKIKTKESKLLKNELSQIFFEHKIVAGNHQGFWRKKQSGTFATVAILSFCKHYKNMIA